MAEVFAAEYFNRSEQVLMNAPPAIRNRIVTMQVFQRKENVVLCGVTLAVEAIKTGEWYDPAEVTVKALSDGDIVQPWETVMTITGPLWRFVASESLYLGIFARMSGVATATRRVVEAANGKPVLFMGDRFDLFDNQVFDGIAVVTGGASAVCTEAMTWDLPDTYKAMGTMPHALIAAFGGDVVAAARAFREQFPDVDLTALVDFNNDCVGDSLRCLAEFGTDLKAVRLDTSGNMMDESIASLFEKNGETIDRLNPSTRGNDRMFRGVNKFLVENVRKALDENGGKHVKIIVSGGFTPEKITKFESEGVPVDAYGVGSSLLRQGIDFTADVVYPIAKQGRQAGDWSRLTEV